MAARFHDELLNYIDVPVNCIHGHKKQQARSSTHLVSFEKPWNERYYQFCGAEKGILICTDVAARGLDIPKVDWIVQPPGVINYTTSRPGMTRRMSPRSTSIEWGAPREGLVARERRCSS